MTAATNARPPTGEPCPAATPAQITAHLEQQIVDLRGRLSLARSTGDDLAEIRATHARTVQNLEASIGLLEQRLELALRRGGAS